MNKNSLYLSFVIVTFLIGISISFEFIIPNYLPILYLLILFPFYIWKCLTLIFKSSSYIKEMHPSFYEKHKSVTDSFDGKIVFLDINEIKKLNDKVIIDYRSRIMKLFTLIILTFLFFLFFSILVVLMKWQLLNWKVHLWDFYIKVLLDNVDLQLVLVKYFKQKILTVKKLGFLFISIATTTTELSQTP